MLQISLDAVEPHYLEFVISNSDFLKLKYLPLNLAVTKSGMGTWGLGRETRGLGRGDVGMGK